MMLLWIACIFVFSVGASFLAEYCAIHFVYKGELFKDAERRVASTAKLVRDLKSRTTERFRQRLVDAEKELAQRQQALMGLTTRAQFIIGVINFASFWMIGSLFAGVVVGRLPFSPIAWFAGMTHRTIPGDDLTEAGYLMFFVLSNAASRPFVAFLMGSERPKTEGMPGFFDMVNKLQQS